MLEDLDLLLIAFAILITFCLFYQAEKARNAEIKAFDKAMKKRNRSPTSRRLKDIAGKRKHTDWSKNFRKSYLKDHLFSCRLRAESGHYNYLLTNEYTEALHQVEKDYLIKLGYRLEELDPYRYIIQW